MLRKCSQLAQKNDNPLKSFHPLFGQINDIHYVIFTLAQSAVNLRYDSDIY